MKIRLLGALALDDGGHDITPSAPKQRELLALFLLNVNRVVSVSDCIHELWDGDPPLGALATVHAHMTQLRKTLALTPSGACRLVTRGRGYLFTAEHREIDLGVFTERVGMAEIARAAGRPAVSVRLVGSALELWRTPLLVDVTAGPVSSVLRGGLLRCRMEALCMRIDLDLELGRHHQLIGELGALSCHHPADERVQTQLMTALYRCGRRVEALTVYGRLREALRTGCGVAPSTRADRLQVAILSADPDLESPRAGTGMSLDLLGRTALVSCA